MHDKIYVPTTFKLKYVLKKYAVYSTLKSKSMALYRRHLGPLAFSSIHQLSSHRGNKGSHSFYFLFQSEAGFFAL